MFSSHALVVGVLTPRQAPLSCPFLRFSVCVHCTSAPVAPFDSQTCCALDNVPTHPRLAQVCKKKVITHFRPSSRSTIDTACSLDSWDEPKSAGIHDMPHRWRPAENSLLLLTHTCKFQCTNTHQRRDSSSRRAQLSFLSIG